MDGPPTGDPNNSSNPFFAINRNGTIVSNVSD